MNEFSPDTGLCSQEHVKAVKVPSRVWNIAAHELRKGERYCTCCERDLTGGAARMLELDQRTDTYHDFGNVPEEKSQGWFPFGLTCARKKIKEAKAKRGEA